MRQPVEAIKGGAARLLNWRLSVPQASYCIPAAKQGKTAKPAKRDSSTEPQVVLSSEELLSYWSLALATGTSSVGVAVAVAYIVAVVAVVVLVVVSIIGVYIQYHAFGSFITVTRSVLSEFDWIRPWCKFEMDTVSVSW